MIATKSLCQNYLSGHLSLASRINKAKKFGAESNIIVKKPDLTKNKDSKKGEEAKKSDKNIIKKLFKFTPKNLFSLPVNLVHRKLKTLKSQ